MSARGAGEEREVATVDEEQGTANGDQGTVRQMLLEMPLAPRMLGQEVHNLRREILVGDE